MLKVKSKHHSSHTVPIQIWNGKWSCIFRALFQSTDHSKHLTVLATFIHSHTHSHTDGRGCCTRCHAHQEQCGVQYLAQGSFVVPSLCFFPLPSVTLHSWSSFLLHLQSAVKIKVHKPQRRSPSWITAVPASDSLLHGPPHTTLGKNLLFCLDGETPSRKKNILCG